LFSILLARFLLAPISPGQTPKREVTVAKYFRFWHRGLKRPPASTRYSASPRAELGLQIENSAPFNVFAAADVEHIERLEKKGLLIPGSRVVYATGILALWVPPGRAAKIDGIDGMVQPTVKVIALAKPELAPYGLAARETLQHLGIWDRATPTPFSPRTPLCSKRRIRLSRYTRNCSILLIRRLELSPLRSIGTQRSNSSIFC
jgi:ABC-type molybdate transport system substrate-binding protein